MKQGTKVIIVALIIFSCAFIYFSSKRTNTSYETEGEGEVDLPVAVWSFKIDDQNIATAASDIVIKNISWENEHASANTVAPGSKGIVTIKIDPTDTQVAVGYEITYYDHTMDPDCLLTVTSIELENEELTHLSGNRFQGFIPLDKVLNGEEKTLIINVEWLNNENENETDSNVGKGDVEGTYLKLGLRAYQYIGE